MDQLETEIKPDKVGIVVVDDLNNLALPTVEEFFRWQRVRLMNEAI